MSTRMNIQVSNIVNRVIEDAARGRGEDQLGDVVASLAGSFNGGAEWLEEGDMVVSGGRSSVRAMRQAAKMLYDVAKFCDENIEI